LTTNIQNSLPPSILRSTQIRIRINGSYTLTRPTLAGKSSSFCNDCSYFHLCLRLIPSREQLADALETVTDDHEPNRNRATDTLTKMPSTNQPDCQRSKRDHRDSSPRASP